MASLLEQIKQRRKSLKLTQSEMTPRTGMSRQQYQQLESKGNPRLETLEAVAEGLDAELILVPKDKLYFILSQLERSGKIQMSDSRIENHPDPWKGLLEE